MNLIPKSSYGNLGPTFPSFNTVVIALACLEYSLKPSEASMPCILSSICGTVTLANYENRKSNYSSLPACPGFIVR